MSRRFPKKNYINFQALAMISHWNGVFSLVRMRGREAKWVGKLQPTPASEVYEVEIVYKVGHTPSVTIRKPILISRSESERIPHVYPGNRLCLYLPDAMEWTRDMPIATTIVPWISLWLYHYEVWHMTGKWLGGGVHPGDPEEKAEADPEPSEGS